RAATQRRGSPRSPASATSGACAGYRRSTPCSRWRARARASCSRTGSARPTTTADRPSRSPPSHGPEVLDSATGPARKCGTMFRWYEAKRPTRSPEKRAAMYRRELEERAALLFRLGYSQKHTLRRLAANVAWDFELHGRPRHASEIEKIVDSV